MTPAALQTEWARVLVEVLVRSGVIHLVFSPGSRSTPLVFAALNHHGLATHGVVDERSAGFFALGLAKAGSSPVALLCTSGSAVAHYFPALIEASQCGVPLVVVSADRPPELQHVAAPQTIDQSNLFGSFVRFHAALGPPEERADAFRLSARLVAQAVARSQAPLPGPVHLNVPLRKPLEPETRESVSDGDAVCRFDAALRNVASSALTRQVVPPDVLTRIAQSLRQAPAGVIALGPDLCPRDLEAELLRELACVSGLPVLVETASGARLSRGLDGVPLLCDAVDFVLDRLTDSAREPLAVLQVGAPLVTSAYARLLEDLPDLELHVLSSRNWPDPSGRASNIVLAALDDCVRQLTEALRRERDPVGFARRDWEARLRRHNSAWWSAVNAVLGATPALRSATGEPDAVRALLAAMPSGSAISVGNSLAIREVDWFSPARGSDIRVHSQRGANGIDGALSSAAGAAAALRRPTVALLGDLTFLHDIGGLAVASRVDVPLVIAVLNNGGGRIFEHLHQGDLVKSPESLEAGWILPQCLNLGALAAGFGLRFVRAEGAAGIAPALAAALEARCCTVLELAVEPHSARETLAAVRRSASEFEG